MPNTPAIAVTLPDYTAEQLRLDTLRGFNGYGDPNYVDDVERQASF